MKTLLTTLFISCISFCFGQEIAIDLFANGFNRPVSIKHAGDDRLFVVEQDGRIKILNSNGTTESTLFLDINNRVINTGNERGLLGLAFHPDYSNNGYFFVNYINNSGDTVISRFERNSTNPNLANPNSELIILTFPQPFSNHNGGDMAFGSDGFLYISSGDGGSGGDPQNNSQNLGNLLGKILRIDVNNSTMANPYAIPADNPFIGNTAASNEIWAYGLRNPWKFSFDRLNNDIWIADVGQNEFEEINNAAANSAGLNYGWRCYEGNDSFNTSGCPNITSLTFPVAEYSHTQDGEFKCSITGGYRYRGSTYPNFSGLYFFADYCSGEIGYLDFVNNNWTMTLEDFPGNWVAFGEDVNGELLVSNISGSIFKLRDALLSINDNALTNLKVFPNPAKHTLSINFGNYNTIAAAKVTILNTQGRLISTVNITNETLYNIDVSEFNSGLYFLKISSTNGDQLIKKFVVE